MTLNVSEQSLLSSWALTRRDEDRGSWELVGEFDPSVEQSAINTHIVKGFHHLQIPAYKADWSRAPVILLYRKPSTDDDMHVIASNIDLMSVDYSGYEVQS